MSFAVYPDIRSFTGPHPARDGLDVRHNVEKPRAAQARQFHIFERGFDYCIYLNQQHFNTSGLHGVRSVPNKIKFAADRITEANPLRSDKLPSVRHNFTSFRPQRTESELYQKVHAESCDYLLGYRNKDRSSHRQKHLSIW